MSSASGDDRDEMDEGFETTAVSASGLAKLFRLRLWDCGMIDSGGGIVVPCG